jgi:glycerophosphoryl diester phosphodiesterase
MTIVSNIPATFRNIAHRGISVYKSPENTRGALRTAFDQGFDIETDVQWVGGEPFLYHDDYIPGPSDDTLNGGGFYLPTGKKLVYDCSPDELRKALFNKAKLEGLLSKQAGETIKLDLNENPIIATLNDLLPIPDGCKAYIELKRPDENKEFNDGLEETVVKWIERNNLHDKVVIISFNIPGLIKARKLDPRIEIGVDVYSDFGRNPQEAQKLRDIIGITCWNPPLEDTSASLVDSIHCLGLQIMPWTWNEDKGKEIAEVRRVLSLGVDGVINNQAAKVKATFQKSLV